MSITVEDIRCEVKEKNVTFIRLMFSDILGTMKNVEIPATDEQLEKVLSNKGLFGLMSQICTSIQTWTPGRFSHGEMRTVVSQD